jgi:hypothetical protein
LCGNHDNNLELLGVVEVLDTVDVEASKLIHSIDMMRVVTTKCAIEDVAIDASFVDRRLRLADVSGENQCICFNQAMGDGDIVDEPDPAGVAAVMITKILVETAH